jgi:hypothetical protein
LVRFLIAAEPIHPDQQKGQEQQTNQHTRDDQQTAATTPMRGQPIQHCHCTTPLPVHLLDHWSRAPGFSTAVSAADQLATSAGSDSERCRHGSVRLVDTAGRAPPT